MSRLLAENDVSDWAPRAPVRMYYGGADTDMPPIVSTGTAARMHARGADAVAVNVGDALDHATAGGPCTVQALLWFRSLTR
jgi:hypothetical protein